MCAPKQRFGGLMRGESLSVSSGFVAHELPELNWSE